VKSYFTSYVKRSLAINIYHNESVLSFVTVIITSTGQSATTPTVLLLHEKRTISHPSAHFMLENGTEIFKTDPQIISGG